MKVSLAKTSSQSKQIDAFCFERVRFLTLKGGLRNLFATIPYQQIKLSASVPVWESLNLEQISAVVVWAQFGPWLSRLWGPAKP